MERVDGAPGSYGIVAHCFKHNFQFKVEPLGRFSPSFTDIRTMSVLSYRHNFEAVSVSVATDMSVSVCCPASKTF